MWTRAELKSKAKTKLKRNYVACILVGLILLVAMGSQQSVTASKTVDFTNEEFYFYQMNQVLYTFALGPNQVLWNNIELMLGGFATFVFLFLKIFVFNPLEVGGCAFFVDNTTEDFDRLPVLNRVFMVFKSKSYRNVVSILLFRDLLLMFWSMLFVIPGIYKGYEYYLIPYLLSDNPELAREEVFKKSKEMMYDQKMKVFIMELSFIPWDFLSIMTFGLAGIFFVNPYKHGTIAEFYVRTKEHRCVTI